MQTTTRRKLIAIGAFGLFCLLDGCSTGGHDARREALDREIDDLKLVLPVPARYRNLPAGTVVLHGEINYLIVGDGYMSRLYGIPPTPEGA